MAPQEGLQRVEKGCRRVSGVGVGECLGALQLIGYEQLIRHNWSSLVV